MSHDKAHRRKQVVLDKSNHVVDSQTATEGTIIEMTTHIPPTIASNAPSRTTRATITHVDHDTHRVSWTFSTPGPFSWLLKSFRTQSITPTEDRKAVYESVEVFSGVVVGVMRWMIERDLRKSFEMMADALKTRAEQRVKDGS